jgi:hypothetical protein
MPPYVTLRRAGHPKEARCPHFVVRDSAPGILSTAQAKQRQDGVVNPLPIGRIEASLAIDDLREVTGAFQSRAQIESVVRALDDSSGPLGLVLRPLANNHAEAGGGKAVHRKLQVVVTVTPLLSHIVGPVVDIGRNIDELIHRF